MNFKHYLLALAICCFSAAVVNAQDVERSRPQEWDGLVTGARFMDRFLPLTPKGKPTSDVWGQEGVKPRYEQNGLEDSTWSYWGGNIFKQNNKYHLFSCRWLEGNPKGHHAWPNSEVTHAISDSPSGPYKVQETIGRGHNPEIQQLKDGKFFIYVNQFSGDLFYLSENLSGPWETHPFTFDPRQRQIVDHMANNTFAKREDGSMLMVGRGGGIWISETGYPPYKQISTESVYPPYEGNYEDPVVWRTNIQYHLIVNDWLGRIAYYMRSKDGINWKLDAGEAYLPGIVKHENGKIEDWYKFERIKMLQDEYGRAYQANFAVADTIKKQDMGNDNHSSKNICIPLTVGRLIELVDKKKIDKNTKEIQLLVKSEPGFNAQKEINTKSLRFGASEEVDYGRGSKVLRTEKRGDDLLITFEGKGNGLTDANFAVKLMGETKKGKFLYGFARLPWLNYNEAILSSKYPDLTINNHSLIVDVEIENFGQVATTDVEVTIESLKEGRWSVFSKGKIPDLKPYKNTKLTLKGTKIGDRNETVNVRITLKKEDHIYEVLKGPVVIR